MLAGVGPLLPFASKSAIAQAADPPLRAPASAPPDSPEAASLPTQGSRYHITGIVIDTITKSPIPNAKLTIEPMSKVKRVRRRVQDQANSALTDAQGHFDLPAPSAGGWSLAAEARGHRSQRLDEHDGYSTAVVLTDASPKFNLTFRLTPASIIEGFVLDEAGEGVRGANVALIYLPPPSPDDQSRPRSRSQQMTDDRGFYKFAALGPGSYEVRVTSHPWYATSATTNGLSINGRRDQSESASTHSVPDPLDVVYPTVWYPGATDPAAATPITLRGGDTQEANFRLLPMPSSHLRIAGAGPSNSSGAEPESRPQPPNTYLTRLLPDGTEDSQETATRTDAHGNTDIGGLAPGTYLVHQQTLSTGITSLSSIQIGAGSPRTVDLSEGVPAATVTVLVDPAADLESLQISFRDLETGHTLYAQRLQEFSGRQIRRRGQSRDDSAPPDPRTQKPDRTVSLPPGKYQVFLNGVGDVHLASIEATGATAAGRTVTIGTGSPKLFLHTAKGFSTVTGIVSLNGQPLPGAMVMLIPATLGNPSGLDMPSRDQSNTDGSFEMSSLLPGGYILIAIDHGWELNWSDPSTLRRYLAHGIPIDVQPASDLRQAIEAQAP